MHDSYKSIQVQLWGEEAGVPAVNTRKEGGLGMAMRQLAVV